MNRSFSTRFIIFLVISLAMIVASGAVSSRSVLAVAPAAPRADFAVPTWMKDAVVYQIFPDRFRNGNTGNDPAGTVGWNSAPTGSNFFGGDLQGVINKINEGYFADLGVNTIYFNPIFTASTNHGYNTGDYYNIASRFGNNALFDTLISTANSRGIRIILDGVFNHAGDDSKYMDAYHQWSDVGACESASSVYRPWFTTGTLGSGCDGNWHWTGWWGYSTLPEFAEIDPVKAFFYRGGSPQSPGGVSVTRYWLDRGIAGWRFDVTPDITHGWWQDLRPYVKGSYPQAMLIGEVWPCGSDTLSSPAYLNGNEMDSVMNYCFRDWAINFANGSAPSAFNNSYNNLRNIIAPSPWYAMMNLVDSHDTVRILNQLGSNKQRQKLIAILQMTLPGAPTVYYGDEVALPGANDPDDRRAYPWADMGGSPDTNMYAHYKTVIGIRNGNSALRGGTLNTLLVNDSLNLYSYIRTDASQKIVVILNNGGSNRSAVVNVSAYLANGAVVNDLLNGNAQYVVSGGNLTVPVNSLWGAILRACTTCATPTPVGPTATRTRTPTPGGPTATRTRTPTTGPTATPGAINPAAWYRIVNQNSNKCVDASNGGTANDTRVQQWACGVTNAQNWNFTVTDSGYYRIGTRNLSTQVLDVSGILLTDGAVIHLWAWSNGGNQQWLPVSMGSGFYRFVARHSGKCLDVPGSSTADGVQLQQYTCNSTAAQNFSLTQVP